VNSRRPDRQKQYRHAAGTEAYEKMLTGPIAKDWTSARLWDGMVTPNDESGRALTERGKLTCEQHGED
jgi:hypothetical protein